ncbi:MAG: two-component system CheB/CheR fusion protein, partial [Rhodoferax sp.]
RNTKKGLVVGVWINATALVNESGKIYAIATTERTIDPKAETPKDAPHDT